MRDCNKFNKMKEVVDRNDNFMLSVIWEKLNYNNISSRKGFFESYCEFDSGDHVHRQQFHFRL